MGQYSNNRTPYYVRTCQWLINSFVEGVFGPFAHDDANTIIQSVSSRSDIRSAVILHLPDDGIMPTPRVLDSFGRAATNDGIRSIYKAKPAPLG